MLKLPSVILSLILGLGFSGLAAGDSAQSESPKPPAEENVTVVHPSRVRLGGFYVGASYHRFRRHSGFYPFGYYPGGFYWYDPFYYPWLTESQLARAVPQGQIQLRVNPVSAEVFIDGGLAGVAGDLEKISLPAGAYTLRFAAPGFTAFEQRVYLLSNKKLKLRVQLTPDPGVQP